ncbi:hypothetical protein MettiDRAFT_0599 [Methanolobus tindarius DSM 2278]|uniref:Uncharacterized protein n=1 Tax=Methanolobus tindarius DSM 2278 TaxID=1090322 RepID=W9DUU1_METTI|nr:SIR2 family protein [Methanolobus tindarius]ETA67186.1 hypothetical protein MettiDRAFT_0599 [Methanolobus tindarius DSM 2278]
MDIEVPPQLGDALGKKECVFFIGAGMSKEANLPSGRDLAKIIASKLKVSDHTNEYNLQQFAEKYINEYSRPQLETLIKDEIESKIKSCDPTSYELLANLTPLPCDIITTNYDRLLENKLDYADFEPIFDNKAVSKISKSKTNLFKLHGDIYFSNLKITTNDLLNYKEENSILWGQVKSLLHSKTTVFIGYSFNDQHIYELYENLCSTLKESAPRVYLVDIDENRAKTAEKFGFKFINSSARIFLTKITEAMDNEKNKQNSTFPYKMDDRSSNNNNPFSFYSTEFFPERKDLINGTFIEPINFKSISDPGNTIIEGHRGSGKSMILKYLSCEQQVKRQFTTEWDKQNIGIYVKLKPNMMKSMKNDRFGLYSNGWDSFFRTYINLIIGEAIVGTLEEMNNLNNIDSNSIDNFIQEMKYLFPSLFSKNIAMNSSNLRYLKLGIRNLRNSLTDNWDKSNTNICFPPDFLYQLQDALKSNITPFYDKNLYILLDEYDNLDDKQQKIVNTLIKDRDFHYKIGVKLLGMSYDCIGHDVLEENHDFVYVNTDRFDYDGSSKEYIGFVREIANRRLLAYNYENSIEELLPAHKNKDVNNGNDDLNALFKDYSGFEDVAKLSSGIIRDFLELCKDMVYMSNRWLIDTTDNRNKLDIVPPNIQNRIIKIHSNILYNEIDNISGVDSNTKEPRKNNVRILIDNFAITFLKILTKSQSKERRTVSSFQLKNIEYLNSTSRRALDDAVSYRLLQISLNQRTGTQGSGYVLGESFKFPRLLCPRFNLSLTQRWPKEIDSKDFNQLFDDPSEFVNKITRRFDITDPKSKVIDGIDQKNILEF